MAVVWMDGCDHLSAAQRNIKGWSGNVGGVATGRFGGQALGADWNAGSICSLGGGTYTTLTFGFAVSHNTSVVADTVLILRSGSTTVIAIRPVSVSGQMVYKVTNPSGTQLGSTGVYVILNDVWHQIEIKVVVSATVGSVEMRLNGSSVPDVSATSVNTGALAIDNFIIGNGSAFYKYDDMYAIDTTTPGPVSFIGDARIETIQPTSNGANTAWTGGFADVADGTAHNGDTSVITSATPGDKETYGLGNLSATTATVHAVQTNIVARKDDAGARTIAPVLRVSSTDYDGTTTPGLSTSFVDYKQMYNQDPTASGWTVTSVNALEAGVKEVS